MGSGPAGYTAAIYIARAGFSVKILTGNLIGGQLMKTHEIENYPGFAESTASLLMQNMADQCKALGIVFIAQEAIQISIEPLGVTDSGNIFHSAQSIIIATGASAKYLNVPGEKELLNYGISTCATCDGFFFRNKIVAVIGGGNTAAEYALYLSKLAAHVHLIHRRDALRAEDCAIKQLNALSNITFHWNTQVLEFCGSENPKKLTHINLTSSNLTTGKIDASGAFVAIGHTPNTAWCKNIIKTDDGGYIKVNPCIPRTSLPGVFVAGDAADYVYRQAITAAGQGCMAGMEAVKYMQEKW